MEIVYGWDLLARESRGLPQPIVVTTSSPWALAEPQFAARPAVVVHVESLEHRFLDDRAARTVDGEVVVGIGGGMVIDAAKYFAFRWGRPLVLVPTITSGNGPFTRSIAVRENGQPAGMRVPTMAERVLIDFGLIQAAPQVLNRSGIGDVLYLHTGAFDWYLASVRGKAVPWDERAGDLMRRTVDRACEQAQEIGAVTTEGIRTIMEAFHTSAALNEKFDHPQVGAGSEHLFAWNLEAATRRHFIHGQIVCLGVVVMALLQRNDPDRMRRAIEMARVPFRPDELGLTWDEVERALLSINEYNRKFRHFHTICDEVRLDAGALRDVREFVTSTPASTGEEH